MEDKKIDRLFQEKLRELEVAPKAIVWKRIEAQLKKKKRRVIPLWWLSGGIAAIIVIGLLLFPIEENKTPNTPKEIETITVAPVEKTKQSTTDKEMPKDLIIKEKIESQSIIAKKDKDSNKTLPNEKNFNKLKSNQNSNIIAINNTIKNNDVIDKELLKDETVLAKNIVDNNNIALKRDSIKIINKKLTTKKDLVAEVIKNNISKTKEEQLNRWSLAPVLALVSSNSFTQTSPIDESLNASPINGNNTLAYGIKITYQLNDKWSIQSGIHLQKMSFSTENLFIASGANNNNLSSVNYNNNALSSNASILIGSSFSVSSDALSPNEVNLIDNNASLDQIYSYIEIPFEAKYKIINNKKFDTNIVAGFSSLFLSTNEVKVKSSIFSTVLGEANNLNTVNFSSNLGLDLNYSLTKKLRLSLTPMLKIQLNTFSDNSNGFKPYYFGVYTGLNFRF